jgi:2-C-methyl-D-erythritol 4-phosphate cytidylyltransferase
LEKTGAEIFLTAGNPENIKITNPGDLIIAEAFLSL